MRHTEAAARPASAVLLFYLAECRVQECTPHPPPRSPRAKPPLAGWVLVSLPVEAKNLRGGVSLAVEELRPLRRLGLRGSREKEGFVVANGHLARTVKLC